MGEIGRGGEIGDCIEPYSSCVKVMRWEWRWRWDVWEIGRGGEGEYRYLHRVTFLLCEGNEVVMVVMMSHILAM